MSVTFHCFCPTYFFWSFSWDHLLQVSVKWEEGIWAAIQSDTSFYLMTNCYSALSKLWDNTSCIPDTMTENCLMVRNLTSAKDFLLKNISHQQYLTLLYFRSLIVATKFSPRQDANYSNLYTDYQLTPLLILLWADGPNHMASWLMNGLFTRSNSIEEKKSA